MGKNSLVKVKQSCFLVGGKGKAKSSILGCIGDGPSCAKMKELFTCLPFGWYHVCFHYHYIVTFSFNVAFNLAAVTGNR